jgi:glutamate-1-semialdehyde aminotransferase
MATPTPTARWILPIGRTRASPAPAGLVGDLLQPGNPRSVFMTPGIDQHWTLSVQHTDEDVARYLNAFQTFAREVTGR